MWAYAALPADISYLLERSKLPQKDVSIYIKELGTDRVVASYNADTTRVPASVIKVMTTYAALLELDFDHRWMTAFYVNGKVSGGTLHGDLIVKGYGDPSLKQDDLDAITDQIISKGIRKITGNIVIDRSYFQVGDKDSSHFDNNPYSPYNAMPDALMFNERTSTVCITPQKSTVRKEINDPSYDVVNNITFVNSSCKGQYAWAGSKVDKTQKSPRLILQGKLSRRCSERKVCKVVTKPYKAFYYALKEKLKEKGVVHQGALHLETVPKTADMLFVHTSQPLEAIISKTAKKSNNLYARHLMLYLGARLYGAPATLKKGREAVKSVLKKHGALGSGTFYIDNGSGLSRKSQISAKILAHLYEHAYRHYGTRWMNTLSIAGIDGTIKKRFRYTAVKNRAWMKTGTLKRVKNIGGYVKNKAGTLYTVVILVNTKSGTWKASKLQSDIILWLSQTSRKSSFKTPVKAEISKKTEVSKPGYTIQVGSFTTQPDIAYMQRIEKTGFSHHVEHEGNYKVFIGRFGSRESAEKALKDIRRAISAGAFIVTR